LEEKAKRVELENRLRRAELEKAELEVKEKELAARKRTMEQEASSRSRRRSVVSLNVGGVIHTLARDTLLRYPGSMLANLLREDIGQTRDGDGNLFLEGDGGRFQVIADALRGTAVDELAVPSAASRRALVRDADYYGLKELASALGRSYDPYVLEERERRQRLDRAAYREGLDDTCCQSDDTIAAIATAKAMDADYLVDLVARKEIPFDANRLANGLPLLFAEKRKVRTEPLRVPTAADVLARLDAFSGGVVTALRDGDGRFPTPHLFFAGGSVLAALTAHSDARTLLATLLLGTTTTTARAREGSEGRLSSSEEEESDIREELRPANIDPPLYYSDVDCYLVGGPVDDAACVGVVGLIARRLAANLRGKVLVTRTTRCVNFITASRGHRRRHLQLILKRFLSPGHVLSGFDVDACQVGVEVGGGEEEARVVATPDAYRALATSINVIDPSQATTLVSYEQRLHKYAERGFAVAVPGLHVGSLAFSGDFELRDDGRVVKVLTPPKSQQQQQQQRRRRGVVEGPPLRSSSSLLSAAAAAADRETTIKTRDNTKTAIVTGLPRLLVLSYVESAEARATATLAGGLDDLVFEETRGGSSSLPATVADWSSRFRVVLPDRAFAFRREAYYDSLETTVADDEAIRELSGELGSPRGSYSQVFDATMKKLNSPFTPVDDVHRALHNRLVILESTGFETILDIRMQPFVYDLISRPPPDAAALDSFLPTVVDAGGSATYRRLFQSRGLPQRLAFHGFHEQGLFAGGAVTSVDNGRDDDWFRPDLLYGE